MSYSVLNFACSNAQCISKHSTPNNATVHHFDIRLEPGSRTPSPVNGLLQALHAFQTLEPTDDLEILANRTTDQQIIIGKIRERQAQIQEHQERKREMATQFTRNRNEAVAQYKQKPEIDPCILHINYQCQIYCAACVEYFHAIRGHLDQQEQIAINDEYRLLWLVLFVSPEIASNISFANIQPFFEKHTLQDQQYRDYYFSDEYNLNQFVTQKRQEFFAQTAFSIGLQQFSSGAVPPITIQQLIERYARPITNEITQRAGRLKQQAGRRRALEEFDFNNAGSLLEVILAALPTATPEATSTPQRPPNTNTGTVAQSAPAFVDQRATLTEVERLLNTATAPTVYAELMRLANEYKDLPWYQRDLFSCGAPRTGERERLVETTNPHPLARGRKNPNWRRRTVPAYRQIGLWVVVMIMLILIGIALLFEPFKIIDFRICGTNI